MYDDVGKQNVEPGYAVEGQVGFAPSGRPHNHAMDALDAAVTRLEKADTLLRERVAPLMGPGRPEVESTRPAPVEAQRDESTLTNNVRDATTRIDHASARIEAVLDRLEI